MDATTLIAPNAQECVETDARISDCVTCVRATAEIACRCRPVIQVGSVDVSRNRFPFFRGPRDRLLRRLTTTATGGLGTTGACDALLMTGAATSTLLLHSTAVRTRGRNIAACTRDSERQARDNERQKDREGRPDLMFTSNATHRKVSPGALQPIDYLFHCRGYTHGGPHWFSLSYIREIPCV